MSSNKSHSGPFDTFTFALELTATNREGKAQQIGLDTDSPTVMRKTNRILSQAG
jgi:hypothetical protein